MNEKNRNLILLRGLPGAGKTELAYILSDDNYPCFSVDDFFTNPNSGEYAFDFSKNHLAYAQCESNVESEMKKGTLKIFVHNTFTMDWEIEPYLKLAEKYTYRIFMVTVENYHENKNIHAVTEEQLKKMAEKYRVKLM